MLFIFIFLNFLIYGNISVFNFNLIKGLSDLTYISLDQVNVIRTLCWKDNQLMNIFIDYALCAKHYSKNCDYNMGVRRCIWLIYPDQGTYRGVGLCLWFQRDKGPLWGDTWQQVTGMVAGRESCNHVSSNTDTKQGEQTGGGPSCNLSEPAPSETHPPAKVHLLNFPDDTPN